MSAKRIGSISLFKMLGLRFIFACAGVLVALLFFSLIFQLIGSSYKSKGALLQQELAGLNKGNGASWRETEKTKISDMRLEAERLRGRYAVTPGQADISPLAARQKIEDLMGKIKSAAQSKGVVFPEEIKFPVDLQQRERAGDAIVASELAATAVGFFFEIEGSEIKALAADVPENKLAVVSIEAVVYGNRFGDLMYNLQRSKLYPQSLEIIRGIGISPKLHMKIVFCNNLGKGA